jgi:D-glycerate 3-kinase
MAARSHPLSAHGEPVEPRQGYKDDFVAAALDDALAVGPPSPAVYGIVGLQGTGKSTLAAQMAALAKNRGLSVVVLSIDDFYLGRRERLRLGRSVHPLLTTRGPPGTHDVALACTTIDALQGKRKRGQSEVLPASIRRKAELVERKIHSDPFSLVRLPRFDKIADRRLPPSRWQRVRQRPDLIVLEGWFLKVPAEPDSSLIEPLNALERDEDMQGVWRRYVNEALANDYAALWQRIDRLLFLQGPGFEIVAEWRWQQEVTLQTAQPQRRAMDRAAVDRFVLFFERVSRQALRTLPDIAERTILLDAKRQPQDGFT